MICVWDCCQGRTLANIVSLAAWLPLQHAPQTAHILPPSLSSPAQLLPAFLQASTLRHQQQQQQQQERQQQERQQQERQQGRQQQQPPPSPSGIAAANGNAIAAYKRVSTVSSPPPDGGAAASGEVKVAATGDGSESGGQLPIAGRSAASLPVQQGRPALTLQVRSHQATKR